MLLQEASRRLSGRIESSPLLKSPARRHAVTDRFSHRRRILNLLVLLLCCAAVAQAQTDKRQLTIEWIFGPEGRAVAGVPATSWLEDSTLMMLDNRQAPGERTFEKLDPATGRRQKVVDAGKALASLKSAVAGVDVNTLPWPI